MSRTPDQASADGALTEAIQRVARAYGMIGEGWALGDWVVSVEFQPFADELIGLERYGRITPHPTVSRHRLVGLLEITRAQMGEEEEDNG